MPISYNDMLHMPISYNDMYHINYRQVIIWLDITKLRKNI